ncbi:MAG TPA: class I adenylate-forming enzyme family protein [Acidimicrobiales bacterium]|nr:class I adenylate-forming enzyme family protein [Acidimicrobiales bacterium]
MPDAPLSWDEAVAQVCGPGGRYELVDGEVDGRPYKLFKNTPPSLRYLFELSSGYGDLDYLVYEDERITFTESWARVGAMGALLVDRYGVQHGDRVAIAMRNYPEWIIAFQAITSVGAVAVALNAWWTTDELEYGFQDCGATVALVDQERAERLAPIREALGLSVIGVRLDQDVEGVDRLEDVLDPSATLPEVPIDLDDDATILYTSGTTGHPKGAVSTHRAVLSGLMAFGARSAVTALMEPEKATDPDAPKDRTSYILVVPLFHATGLIPVMLGTTASGAKLVMMYRWDPERALELIERERVTAFVGVPTMSWDLLESPDFEKRDTSSLVSVGGGGAPAPAELVRRVDKGFKQGKPQIGYGMTETNAYGPGNSGADYLRKPTSSGRAVPVMEVRVVDDDGNPVPTGEVGEICFRGPNLIRGYWNKPEATAEVIDEDGWLRSGDLGRLDEEGFIYVEDRAKDMVLRAGENIYCAEVEGAVYEYPGVAEAAVYGVAHERLGEEVALALVPSVDDFDVDGLLAHLREHLAAFKVPTIVDVRTERLPRNASGKVLKRELRDEAEAART